MTLRWGQRERVSEYVANWMSVNIPVEYLIIAGGGVVVVLAVAERADTVLLLAARTLVVALPLNIKPQ